MPISPVLTVLISNDAMPLLTYRPVIIQVRKLVRQTLKVIRLQT